MSGDGLLQIIHKKPNEGEMSAVDQIHATFTTYDPGEFMKFGSLREVSGSVGVGVVLRRISGDRLEMGRPLEGKVGG